MSQVTANQAADVKHIVAHYKINDPFLYALEILDSLGWRCHFFPLQ